MLFLRGSASEHLGLMQRVTLIEIDLDAKEEYLKLFVNACKTKRPFDIKLTIYSVPYSSRAPRRVPLPLRN